MRPTALFSLAALLICSAKAIPTPTAYVPHPNDRLAVYGRQLIPGGDDEESSSSSSSASSSSSSAPPPSSSSSSSEPVVPSDRSSSSSSSTVPPSSTTSSSTSMALSTSRSLSTNDRGEVETVTLLVTPTRPPSASQTQTDDENENESTGMSTGTKIGLGVAGGIAGLAIIAFITWKLTNKRFSLDDDVDIAWPTAKEPEVTSNSRPATTFVAQSNATASSIDVSKDPYAVPPFPQNNTVSYRDDPSGTAAAAYYDPYRGPLPQTFYTPPGSIDGHAESIPLSTYGSGRHSPGPNMAYEDPHAMGRRSPGPNMAYAVDPISRGATPMQRIGTPVGPAAGPFMAGAADIQRVGTPGSMYGRASPAPAAVPYGHPPDPFGRRSPGPGYAYGHQ